MTIVIVLALSEGMVAVLPAYAPTTSINIHNFTFAPQNATIQTGDSVSWTNNDPVIYTLWFTNASDGSTYLLSPPINPGTTWTQSFPSQVRLKYYDFDRLYITGQLIVVPTFKADFGPTSSASTTVTFLAMLSGGTSPYKFSWSFGDGTTSTLGSPTHTYQSFGTYTVALSVTDSSIPNAFTVSATHMVTLTQPFTPGGGGGKPPVAR